NYPADYYSIWSTPMAESDSQISSIFNNAIIAYKYDASQNPSAYVQIGGGTLMEEGKGYFIRSDNDSGVLTRTFSGTINNGNIEETIYHNSSTDNFNVIGNPYPSAINWLKLYEDNSDVLGGTMYYWKQSYVGVNNLASDWIDFNSLGSSVPEITGDIGAAQGISVRSSQSGTSTVTFKNTQRVVSSNDQFFRSSENPDEGKSWFRLTGPTNVYSPILIGFLPEATDDYESIYDGEFINEGASLEFYSFISDNKFSIQGRSELQPNQSVEVPIGFQVITAGDYTISNVLDYIDASFDILLEDTFLNTMTDLRTSSYTFNISSPVEDNDRFILHYNYSETLSNEEFSSELNSIKSYFLNNELYSIADERFIPERIQLFDISGREVLNTNFSERIKTGNLANGIYIVKYSIQNSRIIAKKVIKK
ncbi:MAG: T9SS type A sorting domain-containing protein, partial [Bacteroidia bacterium]|nr:T9SS type A sorting domain-containing protein [Bacteroidia bacterium]